MAEEKDVDKDDEALLKASREGLSERISAEYSQRALMLDDLKFATLDQWPADIRAAREGDVINGPRPCLTIDQINQYTTQVGNEMLKNKPSVKPRPVDDKADPGTAKIFAGLIRHIEDQSSAKIAYQTAGQSAVDIGLGFFRIVADYVSPDSFDQELIIKRVPDTFSVYLGHHLMPDGSDAEKAWVHEAMLLEDFKRDYPEAETSDAEFDGLGTRPVWKTKETVTVCEYFYKKYTPEELLFLADGKSLFKDDYDKLPEPRPEITGRRDSNRMTVMWCKHSGCEVLERRELKTKYIPIVEEVGKEKIVEGKRILWGLVRPAKDSLRALNYWVSALTEKMALSPKAPWVGAVGQFATQGDRWDKANTVNYSKLEYDNIDVNGNSIPAPRRTDPMQMEPAMVGLIGMFQNFVKSSLGMYKASVGDTESQQSGRAILALKNESDTGTAHFGENQVISVTHCGRILIDWIPYVYDTKRVLRILGEDGKAQSVQVDPKQSESMREIRNGVGKVVQTIYNLGVGKFDVTPTVGPGYTTGRQEAATVMTELANSAKDPVSAAIMRYGAVKNSDFAGSEEIMGMLKAMLPPQIKPPEDGQEPMPTAAMQKIAQMGQQMQLMDQKGQELAQENQQLKAGVQEGMAKVNADHDAKMKALALDEKMEQEKARIAREKFEFEKTLETEKVNHSIDLDERKALAEYGRKKAQFEFDQTCRAEDQQEKIRMENETGAAALAPNMMQSMQAIVKQFEILIQSQQELKTKLIEQMSKPKKVTLGSIQRNESGITGASVTVQ